MKKGGVNKEIMDNYVDQYSKYKLNPYNIEKEKANNRLQTARIERTRKELPKARVMDNLIIDEKISVFDKENNFRIIDLLSHETKNISASPKILIPDIKEGLWVVKPIGKHVLFIF